MPPREANNKDRWKVAAYILLTIVVIAAGAAALLPGAGPREMVLWLVIFFGGLFLLVRWHARSTAYRCPACGHEFEISTLTDFLSPHTTSKKFLKCPQCGKRKWATVLLKKDR
jgi:DNA-directed RNA polymerase subunit RPC12/RpoP